MPIGFQDINSTLNIHRSVFKKSKISPEPNPYGLGDGKQYIRLSLTARGYRAGYTNKIPILRLSALMDTQGVLLQKGRFAVAKGNPFIFIDDLPESAIRQIFDVFSFCN
jgi:hypothetical protein